MSRRNTSPESEWNVYSAFVPRRDGRDRVEAAVRLILGRPADSSSPTDERTDHAGGHLRPGIDSAPGTGPDD